jgi:formate dehydrogenase subunit delta
MIMDVKMLIEMVNQIAEFFDSMPDHEEAIDGVADHVRKFWAPRMRSALLDVLDEPETIAALEPFALEALRKHRAMLTPQASGVV